MSRRDVFPSHNGADKPTVEELARRLAEEQRERAEEQAWAAAQLRRRALWLGGVLILAVVAMVVAVGFGKQAADSATIVRTAEARPQAESTRAANAEATAEAWQLEAERQKAIAESRALAAQAEDVMEQDPQLAVLLGLEAVYQTHQNAPGTMTTEACSVVHRAVVRSPWRATLSGHTYGVNHAAWSGDGGRIVTASYDNTAKVWDAATGEELLTLSEHTGDVTHAAWSGDDGRIVTASEDGTAKVWDADTGEELLTLSGHTDSVYHAAWSGDGGRIVTASADGSARIYFVRVDDLLIEVACSRTGRNMTKAEWRRYMGPDVPYRRTCPNLPEGPE